ncbi:SHOCT domain-containing protein [Microbacterium oleivorans]|uniref:SHOCT domain-containing protein n=1 Tax=Microbacterium TaxID=33882 RepID=UPI001C3081D4
MMWDDGDGGYDMGFGMGWGWGWLWAVLILIGIGLLVYVAVRLSTRSTTSPAASAPPTTGEASPGPAVSSAQRILEERYARGEIDTDEFNERSRVLRGG